MKAYVLSLALGLLVGAIYGLFNVRSPAPPVIALLGLLGMLLGEQLVPLGRQIVARERVTVSWLKSQCGSHIFGSLPRSEAGDTPAPSPPTREG